MQPVQITTVHITPVTLLEVNTALYLKYSTIFEQNKDNGLQLFEAALGLDRRDLLFLRSLFNSEKDNTIVHISLV